MNVRGKKVSLLRVSEFRRQRLIIGIRERLRATAQEAKMWHELLRVDSLTINGKVVWDETKPSRQTCAKSKRRR